MLHLFWFSFVLKYHEIHTSNTLDHICFPVVCTQSHFDKCLVYVDLHNEPKWLHTVLQYTSGEEFRDVGQLACASMSTNMT